MTDPLTKADRLAIGGAVAPVVRRQAAAPRRVTLVDKDGKPVRETTSVEVAKAMLARSEIEFSVQEGKRPEWVNCKTCGTPVKVHAKGGIPTVCRSGTYKCQCGASLTAKKCGNGRSCRRCTARAMITAQCAELTQAERSARARAAATSIPKEQRSARARAISDAKGAAWRHEIAKIGNARLTPEQRSERMHRAWQTRRAKRGAT